jgi:hypothetical protein
MVAMLFLFPTTPVAMDIDGRLTNPTVNFGQWQTAPVLDGFPIGSPADRNNHELIPENVKIPPEGAINFPISGFHQPIIEPIS